MDATREKQYWEFVLLLFLWLKFVLKQSTCAINSKAKHSHEKVK